MLQGLDLFTGIGGITLALSDWVNPIGYCEIDNYCQKLLRQKMESGDLPKAEIYHDVTKLKGDSLDVDIIYGGFPCQDISCAGNGKGLAGERSGLFFEIIRLVKETNAPWVFLENVPAIRTRGLSEVIGAFTDLGYDCRWTCVSAAEVGAPHLRKRWFLLAHTNSERGRIQQIARRETPTNINNNGAEKSLANAERKGLQRKSVSKARSLFAAEGSWWTTEPAVGRVANGVSSRVDRIKALGNAVVPLQAKTAFERLMGYVEIN